MKMLTHATLLISEDRALLENRVETLASAAVCSNTDGLLPCGVCNDCRKASNGIHPDIMYVYQTIAKSPDKPRLHLSIGVSSADYAPLSSVHPMRELRMDAAVKPNEASKKVYIIHDADKMNTGQANAANAFLKLLEEPPPTVVFILTGERLKDFLPTIRSRCIIERLTDGSSALSTKNSQADAILNAFFSRAYTKLASECIKLEKGFKREELLEVLNSLYIGFAESAKQNHNLDEALQAIEVISPILNQLRAGINLGGGHVAGALMVKLNDIILH